MALEKRIKVLPNYREGSVCRVYFVRTNYFPGIGGEMFTAQCATAAYRVPKATKIKNGDVMTDLLASSHWLDQDNRYSVQAFNLFLLHSIIKKLDDYFTLQGKYAWPHISRPLGTTRAGAMLYQWAKGTEGFHSNSDEGGNVKIEEWDVTYESFLEAGIDISSDTSFYDDDSDRCKKNIIFEEPFIQEYPKEISDMWKRIDFGSESLSVDYDKLARFLSDHEESMGDALKSRRVTLMEFAVEYLMSDHKDSPMSFPNMYRILELSRGYRKSTLGHFYLRKDQDDAR